MQIAAHHLSFSQRSPSVFARSETRVDAMTSGTGRTLPPMTALPVFEAVGRHLSVARAAEELRLTPGAVSRQVRNLEGFLGVALFERGHRRIVFTPAGRAYWGKVAEMLGGLRAATREMASEADERPLVIASPRMFLQKRVVPVLGSLYAAHPDLAVNFVTDQRDIDTLDGQIAVNPQPRKGEVIEILAAADLSPVCSPAYVAAAPPLAVPADLERHTLLRSTEYTRNWERWLAAIPATISPRARVIEFESSGLELTAAAEGLGIAVVRLGLVRDDIAAGRLVALFPEHTVHDHYAFRFHETKLRAPRFRLFRKWLKATLGEVAGGVAQPTAV